MNPILHQKEKIHCMQNWYMYLGESFENIFECKTVIIR